MDQCVLTAIWHVPIDAGEESLTDYFVIINGTSNPPGEIISLSTMNDQMQVSTLLPVPSCAAHNVTIRARNACGDIQSSNSVALDPNLRHRINSPDTTPDSKSYGIANSIANGMLTLLCMLIILIVTNFFSPTSCRFFCSCLCSCIVNINQNILNLNFQIKDVILYNLFFYYNY